MFLAKDGIPFFHVKIGKYNHNCCFASEICCEEVVAYNKDNFAWHRSSSCDKNSRVRMMCVNHLKLHSNMSRELYNQLRSSDSYNRRCICNNHFCSKEMFRYNQKTIPNICGWHGHQMPMIDLLTCDCQLHVITCGAGFGRLIFEKIYGKDMIMPHRNENLNVFSCCGLIPKQKISYMCGTMRLCDTCVNNHDSKKITKISQNSY
jgi:hypothetical protein